MDVSESSSCYTNSDSKTETDVCDEEVPTNSQASHCSDQLQSYQGFEMQNPKKTKTNRSRKIRTVNKNKPPTGKKKSAQKIYNKPERVRTLIQMYNKHRVEKVIKKGKVVKEVLCTPEPFANAVGMLFCPCCRETQLLHRGSVSRCTLTHLDILCWGRIHSFTNISCSGKTFLSVAW